MSQKIMNPIIVPPGRAQLAVYRYHLDNPPLRLRKEGAKLHLRVQVGMQLTLLRLAALCPHTATLAESITGVDGPKRSWTEFTPKFAAVLNIIQACLNVGQQVIIGSPFHEFSSTLHTRLREAGVTSYLLDDLISPAERKLLAAKFRSRWYPVLIMKLKTMGEGYNLGNCSNLVLPTCSWGFDEIIHRISGLNSSGSIMIYPIITSGTIDQLIYELYSSEKSDAASLAFDDRFFSEPKTDLDLEQLLAETIQIFQADTATIDEQRIVEEWDSRTSRILCIAEARFHEHHFDSDEAVIDFKMAMDSLKIPSPTQLSVDILRKHYAAGTYKRPTKTSIQASFTRIRRKK